MSGPLQELATESLKPVRRVIFVCHFKSGRCIRLPPAQLISLCSRNGPRVAATKVVEVTSPRHRDVDDRAEEHEQDQTPCDGDDGGGARWSLARGGHGA